MDSDEIDFENGVIAGLKWSAAQASMPGEKECGDLYLVQERGDEVLIAAIDGLGHGAKAALVAKRARSLLKKCGEESPPEMIRYCHEHLKQSRGVVMSMAMLDLSDQTLCWLGVGNVKGSVFKKDRMTARKRIISQPGIIGYNLPVLRAETVGFAKGDMLVFATDGVNSGGMRDTEVDMDPSKAVQYIARQGFKSTDDSLVVAVKFLDG